MRRAAHQQLYFLESTTDPGHYMHYLGVAGDGQGNYELRPGLIGAAVWKLPVAEDFMKVVQSNNLKAVPCEEAIKSQAN